MARLAAPSAMPISKTVRGRCVSTARYKPTAYSSAMPVPLLTAAGTPTRDNSRFCMSRESAGKAGIARRPLTLGLFFAAAAEHIAAQQAEAEHDEHQRPQAN